MMKLHKLQVMQFLTNKATIFHFLNKFRQEVACVYKLIVFENLRIPTNNILHTCISQYHIYNLFQPLRH